jgi:predicted RNA-binding Zn ribbon-like protein
MDAAGTDLLIDFLNTVDEESREDEWPDDAAARAWFRSHGLTTRGVVAREARAVRDAVRAAIDGRTPPPAALAAVPLHAAPAGDGLALASAHPLGPFVAAAVRLAYEGHWDRLKLCDMHSCRYAFYDTSRNRSGRWCTMSVCGNRAKTRAFRERHRSG